MQPNTKEPIVAHGLTRNELNQVHETQKQGGELEMIPANKNPEYQIKAIEQHMVHVLLRMPGVDPQTEQPMHKPFVQMFYVDDFNKMDKGNAFKGYKTQIIHDPRDASSIVEDLKNDKVKPIGRMNELELRAEYERVYGVPCPDTLTGNDNIRAAIQERTDFLSKEAEADEKRKADEDEAKKKK